VSTENSNYIDFKTGEILNETPCFNSFSKRNIYYDVAKGEKYRIPCTTYGCKKHGWKRKKRLVDALTNWLSKLSHIRFWTFTVSSKIAESSSLFNELFVKIWHRFITELRRTKLLSEKQRKVDYVKVYELHKSGKLHVHLFFSDYLPRQIIERLWDYSIRKVTKFDEFAETDFPSHKVKLGNTFVKGMKSAKFGANYVAKYVVKMAQYKNSIVRSWSKSSKVSIFPSGKKNEFMVVVEHGSIEHDFFVSWHTLLVSTNTDITNISQLKAILKSRIDILPSKIKKINTDSEFRIILREFCEQRQIKMPIY